MPHTIRLHRVLQAKPERVYRAFIDPHAKAKWLPPYGFYARVLRSDENSYQMSFTNFTTGNGHSFSGEYIERVPNQRVRYTDRFDDAGLPGTMTVTVEIKQVSCGTELHVTQEGVPDVIPAEGCYLGWQESLAQLAKLVDPEIPDA
jgi:uncharacterized protein YndB with AHSA1/START domain